MTGGDPLELGVFKKGEYGACVSCVCGEFSI